MAVERGSITGTGVTKQVSIRGKFSLDLKDVDGTIQLERSFDGGIEEGDTWNAVDTAFTADTQKVGMEPLTGMFYRLNCTVFGSGPIAWVLGSRGIE